MTREEMATACELIAGVQFLLDSGGSMTLTGTVPSDLTAIRAAAAELRKTCEWRMNSDGYWDTECGQAFVSEDGGTAAEHKFKFCCYCGGALIDVPYVDPFDEDDEDDAEAKK